MPASPTSRSRSPGGTAAPCATGSRHADQPTRTTSTQFLHRESRLAGTRRTSAVHQVSPLSGHNTFVYVPFLDHPRPIAFAHRGGAAHAPENSWAAFEHAVKLGFAYLETDARATFDGKLMAFHDRNLERMTEAEGLINMKSYREVAALRVAGSEPIPLIEDLLGAWPDVRFNIDVKDEAGIPLLPAVLRRTSAGDRAC